MKTNSFDRRTEQDSLKEIQILRYHGDHLYVPAFNKGLKGLFKIVIGQEVVIKRSVFAQVFFQENLVGLLGCTQSIFLVAYMDHL